MPALQINIEKVEQKIDAEQNNNRKKGQRILCTQNECTKHFRLDFECLWTCVFQLHCVHVNMYPTNTYISHV